MSEQVAEHEVQDSKTTGFIQQSLLRNNKQIRDDRAQTIIEDLEMTFKRKIEDIELEIRRTQRDRRNMYDFSPTNSYSLVLNKDVDAQEIYGKDKAHTIKLRELQIELDLMKERYNQLFINFTEV